MKRDQTLRTKRATGNPFPKTERGAILPLMVERDLCHPEIITRPKFMEFVREVKDRFRSL